MSFDGKANFAIAPIIVAPSPAISGLTVIVQAGQGSLFTGTPPYNLTVWEPLPPLGQPTAALSEIVRVEKVEADKIIFSERAQEGTTAKPIGPGWVIADTITVKSLTDIEQAVETETSRALAAESMEKSAREAGDSTNATAISAEKTRAEGIEALKATIASLNAETVSRETADSLRLLKSENLKDLGSASTARTNLGLGSAAVEPSSAFDPKGAAASAEAAASTALSGEKTRAETQEGLKLAKAENLKDVSSAATARTNLGLGTAATEPSTAFDAKGAAASAQTAAEGVTATEKTRAETAEALKLAKASNLSDLSSASTARTNLGLGTAAVEPSSAFDAKGAAATAEAKSIPLAQKGAASGVAELTASSKLPIAELPAPNAGGHYETSFGNGSASSFVIKHELKTLTPDISVVNQSTGQEEGCRKRVLSENEIELSATAWETTPPGSATYRVSVDASSGLVATNGSVLTSYALKSEVGANGGIAPLESAGRLPEARLPTTATTIGAPGFAPSVIWLDSTPEFYGAVGNGSTDDTVAFQALSKAINEKGGGVARLSGKTYIVDGYEWESGVCWEGRSDNATILKAKAGSSNIGMITIPIGRVRGGGWKNIQFVPNGNNGQHCFYLYAQESGTTLDGGVWECYFENLRIGVSATAAQSWTGACMWFRGGATGSKLPHQYNNFRNVVMVRANTGEFATTSRCFKATGECNQFNFDGSCNIQGQESYGKIGTNVELSREFLFATTLTSEATLGASELKVSSSTGFEANKQFSIGEGATNEILTISAVEGTTLKLTGTTKFVHANSSRLYLLSGTVGSPAENAPSVIGFDAGCTIQYGDLAMLVDRCSNIDTRSVWFEGLSRGMRVRTSSSSVNMRAAHLANVSEGEANGTGEATVGSKTISKASGTWANGNQINGPGIPAGTTVESGGGTETLTLTANVVANGTEGAATISLVKGGRGEGYIAKYEGASSGHVCDHFVFGATDQGVVSEGGNARVDNPIRPSASPAITSTGVVSTIASAESISIGVAREIVLTGSTSVRTIVGQHSTGETLRIRISNAAIRLLNTGNIDLQGNGEVHVYPADVLTLMRTDTTSRTWKLVGVQRKQNTGASAELGASVKIANNAKESGNFNASGARIGDYVLAEYTNAFSTDGVIVRGEVREEGKIHWWILNLSGAEITLNKGFIKGEALRPT